MRIPAELFTATIMSRTRGLFFSSVFLLTFSCSLLSHRAQGLECYECLSLSCPSGAICESIKKTMIEIFVPKRHVIHFDPNDPCPEYEDPKNSSRWANLTRECQRSDSVCLVSPIEVISIADGSKGGKNLEPQFQFTTTGFLRGCASRRKLLENDPTIKVQVNLLTSGSKAAVNSSRTQPNSSYNSNPNYNEVKSRNSEVYNMMNSEESELDLSKLKFDDDYVIRKVYSHAFYIDQWTDNATRCYQDHCNAKVKIRSNVAAPVAGRTNNSFLIILGSLLALSISNQISISIKSYSSSTSSLCIN